MHRFFKPICFATGSLLLVVYFTGLDSKAGFASYRVADASLTSNVKSEAARLFERGKQQANNQQFQAALQTYQQVLHLQGKNQDLLGTAGTWYEIGFVYRKLRQSKRALASYQQALEVYRQIGDRTGEARTLNELGLAYGELDQYSKALELHEAALKILKQINEPRDLGRVLNNIGIAHYNLGHYSKSLEFYQQALVVCQQIFDRSSEGRALNNLGLTYTVLGQYEKANGFFQQALVIRLDLSQHGDAEALIGLGKTYHNIGFLLTQQGQYKQSLEVYQKALAVRQRANDRQGEGRTLNSLGKTYRYLKQYPKALSFLKKALAISREGRGDRRFEGRILNDLGETYQNLKHYAKSFTAYQKSLTISCTIGDLNGQRITLDNLGGLFEQQEKTALAIIFYKEAVNLTEAIRQELQVLPRDQQETYTRTIASTYRHLADLLLQQDRVLEAQQVLDLLKVQELNDYLQNVRGNGQQLIVLRPEAEILKRYGELQNSAIQIGQQLTELRKLDAKNSLTPTQQNRLAQLTELEKQINRQFNEFIESKAIVDLVAQLRHAARNQNLNLEDLNALRDNLKTLNAVLLYPLILDDRLELIITTPDAPPIRRTVKNLKRVELNRVIAEFRSALEKRQPNVQQPAQQLYDWLIKPIEADLAQSKPKTIIYAPDGQLRYIPLAALHDGKQWLIERYRINNIIARSVTDLNTPRQPQLQILAGAFGNQSRTVKVGDRQFPFAGLPFTLTEVQALATTIPATTVLMEQAFSRIDTLKRLNSFNVIHLATHGQFVVGKPEDSFIAFGDGGYIPLNEIKDLTMTNVDLVVLSACETALNGVLGNGEEILGLGYQFQRAGAKAVVASLWSVDDGGTQALMDAFYTALKQGNVTKAEALQKAQIEMIQNGSSGTGQRGDSFKLPTTDGSKPAITRDPSHPYYWAPFILIGNGL